MGPHLRLYPGQQALTPAQEAEAHRFAAQRIQAQLSTAPVDEPAAEALLKQAYAVAGCAAPQDIHWVDGPLQLVAMASHVAGGFYAGLGASVRAGLGTSVRATLGEGLQTSVVDRVRESVRTNVWAVVAGGVRASQGTTPQYVEDSVRAYEDASWLAYHHFLDAYLAPNEFHALAHFNERVSGYWLGEELAIIVRRPRILCRDEVGRLHSATGRCMEYCDGWGFYAWHGVRVPEKVILAPEQLNKEDWSKAENVEVRRAIQERMGGHFVWELGGVVRDTSPRGTLYEVRLPEDDPEGVARYVQVQDASTARQYFLRVPPTIQTAAEAVAWSFQLAAEEYGPAQET